MKRKICGLIILIGLVLMVGIIGGIEWNNQPFTNALWFFPIMAVMWGAGKIGGFYNY